MIPRSFPDCSPKLSPSKGNDPSIRAQSVQMAEQRKPSEVRWARKGSYAWNSCTNELPSSTGWKENVLIFFPLQFFHMKCTNRARKNSLYIANFWRQWISWDIFALFQKCCWPNRRGETQIVQTVWSGKNIAKSVCTFQTQSYQRLSIWSLNRIK